MAATLSIQPTAGALGAEVHGVSLDQLGGATADQLRDALSTYLVLFLPGLAPDLVGLRDLGRVFGELESHPYLPTVDEAVPEVIELDSEAAPKADVWHTDVTFSATPPHAGLLHMVASPEFGGDTMWINTVAVYESLSAPLREMLEGLTCRHTASGMGDKVAEHPMVRVDPVTGRKGLFVNKQFSRRIPQLSRPESQMLLQHLFRWQEQVKFSCRWRWHVGDVVIWDERFTLHSVVDDTKERRTLRRATVVGETPLAVDGAATWPEHETDTMASSGFFGVAGYEF